MRPLTPSEMTITSGGEVPLFIVGATAGDAYYIGQTLITGGLSLAGLAASAVAGIAIARIHVDMEPDHDVPPSHLLCHVLRAGALGYLSGVLIRANEDCKRIQCDPAH